MAGNVNKEVWEGWTVGAIYKDVKPFADMIQRGESWKKPFESCKDIADWIKNDRPNFKKGANDVAKLLSKDYGLPAKAKEYER